MDEKPYLPGEELDYADETIAWFNAWRESPLTDNWTPIQWQYLFATAVIHTTAYMTGQFGLLSQVAAREKDMGLSFARAQAFEPTIIKMEETPLAKAQKNRQSRAENKGRAKKAV